MSNKRTKRKRSKKKSSKQSLVRSSARSQFVKMFPRKVPVEITYCDTVVVPSLDGGSAPYKFRLNSIFDPDETSIGHQPRGHDQWSAMYQRYCVVGAKVLVEPIQTPSNTDVDATLFGYVDDDLVSDGYTVEELRELNMNHTTHKYVELGESHRGTVSNKSPNLKFNVNMKKFFGINKNTQIMTVSEGVGSGDYPVMSDPHGLTASTQNNPINICWLKLHSQTNYPTGEQQTITARVTIKYYVIYHDPKEVTAS